MPTAKRERQRAGRQARQEALEKARKRRASVRRAATFVVIIAVVVGAYSLIHHSGKSTRPSAPPVPDTQSALNAAAVKAGCPSNPATVANHDVFSKAPAMTIDTSKTYTAVIKTDVGTMDVALAAKSNPTEVNNFVFLADQHFYNCDVFPRVIPSFMNQTGDPSQSNSGTFGYTVQGSVPTTATNASSQYPLGSLACAKTSTAPNGTCSDQFFIITGSEGESLPPQYSLFGQVTSGMIVAEKINTDGDPNANSDGTGTRLKVTHRMLSVTIQVT